MVRTKLFINGQFVDSVSEKETDAYAGQKALFRLPKEDKYYDIWDWSHTDSDDDFRICRRHRIRVSDPG